MKVTPTRTDSRGTGYYRGENGRYYYGNPRNGYMKETRESARQHENAARKTYDSVNWDFDSPSFHSGGLSRRGEKILAAAVGTGVGIFFAIAIPIIFLLAGVGAWSTLMRKTFSCLWNAGIFAMIRYYWQTFAYGILAIVCVKKTIANRTVPWQILVCSYFVISFLVCMTSDGNGLAEAVWNALWGTAGLGAPVVVILYAIHMIDRKIIRRYS